MSSTLFGAAVPSILNADDGNTYVLGTDFTPNIDGTITHARRYFPTTPQAGVSMGLYRVGDQALLGSVNFADGLAAGWQQVAFASPISVTAGVQYQITYFTPSKYVATSAYGFPFTSGDLSALAAPNGVFNASIPSLQFASGNLSGTAVFADVVFEPAGGGGTTTVTSDLDLRWAIKGRVTSDLDIRWGIKGIVFSDLSLRWRIAGEQAQQVRQGSWYGLLSAWEEDRQYQIEERTSTPVACPNDGEPLLEGPNGEIYCPYDGWRPR
jgi:hypothetical protein